MDAVIRIWGDTRADMAWKACESYAGARYCWKRSLRGPRSRSSHVQRVDAEQAVDRPLGSQFEKVKRYYARSKRQMTSMTSPDPWRRGSGRATDSI